MNDKQLSGRLSVPGDESVESECLCDLHETFEKDSSGICVVYCRRVFAFMTRRYGAAAWVIG